MGNTVRLFIALLLPNAIKKDLEAIVSDLKPRVSGVRWVAAKNMHLTLKFMGETQEEKVGPISQLLEKVASGRKPLTVTLDRIGGFPNLKTPRVVWVGLNGVEPAAEMAGLLNRLLKPLGFEPEKRPFSAHLTLGRIKLPIDASPLATYAEQLKLPTGSVILDRIALVKSTLTPGGPIYENLEQKILK
jgi:RNA 2',3'-cyclic 3'-phosphodiesterase